MDNLNPFGANLGSTKPGEDSRFRCVICGKPSLSQCSNCQEVFYCSPEHQALDWPTHKLTCLNSTKVIQSKEVFDKNKKSDLERIKAIDNEFDKLIIGDIEPLGPQQKLALEEKTQRLRKDAIVFISKFEYKSALMKCKDLIVVSKRLFFNEPYKYFYAFLSDSLLLAKCFIREDKFTQAEEVLTQGWRIFNKYVTNENYKITKVVFEERDDNDLEALNKYINTATESEDHNEVNKEKDRIKNNLTIIKELKRRTTLLSCFASLFYNVGLLKNAEEIYIVYVQMIEQNYGLLSLEASNCYYLLGIFYLENSYLKKAMACMKKALEIRQGQVGSNHTSISDCYYNIGLIFYVLGNKTKAHSWILQALSIRQSNTGEENVHVARIYEMLAQLSLDDKDLKTAYEKLKKSIQIKNTIFTDPEHPDVIRTTMQLKELSAKLGLNRKPEPTQPEPARGRFESSGQGSTSPMALRKESMPMGMTKGGPFGTGAPPTPEPVARQPSAPLAAAVPPQIPIPKKPINEEPEDGSDQDRRDDSVESDYMDGDPVNIVDDVEFNSTLTPLQKGLLLKLKVVSCNSRTICTRMA